MLRSVGFYSFRLRSPVRCVDRSQPDAMDVSSINNTGHARRPVGHKKELGWSSIIYNCSIRFLLWSFAGYIMCLSVVDVQQGKELFSWHPPLLTLSLVLMSESMMCFSAENLATHQLDYKTKLNVHWILQALSAACALAGFIVVFIHKNNLGKYHFTTYHGLYGLSGLITVLVTGLTGGVAKFGIALRHLVRPVHLKIVHAALGLMNYKLFVVTAVLGLYSSWFGKHGTNSGFYACFALLLIVGQYVGSRPALTLLARLKNAWMRAYDL